MAFRFARKWDRTVTKVAISIIHVLFVTDRLTDRHADRQTYRHTDRQTDRQTGPPALVILDRTTAIAKSSSNENSEIQDSDICLQTVAGVAHLLRVERRSAAFHLVCSGWL